MSNESGYVTMNPVPPPLPPGRRPTRFSTSSLKPDIEKITEELTVEEEPLDDVDEATPYSTVTRPPLDEPIYSTPFIFNSERKPAGYSRRISLDMTSLNQQNVTMPLLLEHVFPTEDTGEHLMKEKNFEAAFNVFSNRYSLSPALFRASYLRNFYVVAFRMNKADKAMQVRDDITELLRSHTETNPDDIKRFAKGCLDKGKHFEAMLFYQIAAATFMDKPLPKDRAFGVRWCVLGMKNAAERLLKTEPSYKALVQLCVTPLMREMVHKIQAMNDLDIKSRAVSEAWCLHYIGIVDGLVGNWTSFESEASEAVKLLRSAYLTDASRLQVLGACLNNLGYVCSVTNRKEEAIKYYRQAVDAKKRACDYSSDKEKQKDIELSQNNLKKICPTPGSN